MPVSRGVRIDLVDAKEIANLLEVAEVQPMPVDDRAAFEDELQRLDVVLGEVADFLQGALGPERSPGMGPLAVVRSRQ